MTNIVYFLAQAAGNPNTLLTTVLLPFLLIFVILWGVLNMMNIFGKEAVGRKINIVVAMIITIFAAFTDAWGIVATQLAAATGIFTFIMFFAVFIIGTIFWAIGRTRYVYNEHGVGTANYSNVKAIDKQMDKYNKKMEEAHHKGNENMAKEYFNNIKALKEKKEYLLGIKKQ